MLAALREQAQTQGTRGAWGAAGAMESVAYYLHGAAAWLTLDLTPAEHEALEAQLDADAVKG